MSGSVPNSDPASLKNPVVRTRRARTASLKSPVVPTRRARTASLKSPVFPTRGARTELICDSTRQTQNRLIRATFSAAQKLTAKEKREEADLYRYFPRVRPRQRQVPIDRAVCASLRKKEREARRSTVPLDDGIPTGELQQYVMEQAQDIMYEMDLQHVAKDWLDASALLAVGLLFEEHISALAKPLKGDKLYRVSKTKKQLQEGLLEMDRQIEQEKSASLTEAKQILNDE